MKMKSLQITEHFLSPPPSPSYLLQFMSRAFYLFLVFSFFLIFVDTFNLQKMETHRVASFPEWTAYVDCLMDMFLCKK